MVLVPAHRMDTIALLLTFLRVQSVLKWLHHPPLKYVILLHRASSSHDFWHAARSETLLDDLLR